MEGLIQPFLQNINFSVVSANIKPDQTLAELHKYYSPYKVISVGSEKVAVVGYTSAETPFLSRPGKSVPMMSRPMPMLCFSSSWMKLDHNQDNITQIKLSFFIKRR